MTQDGELGPEVVSRSLEEQGLRSGRYLLIGVLLEEVAQLHDPVVDRAPGTIGTSCPRVKAGLIRLVVDD